MFVQQLPENFVSGVDFQVIEAVEIVEKLTGLHVAKDFEAVLWRPAMQ